MYDTVVDLRSKSTLKLTQETRTVFGPTLCYLYSCCFCSISAAENHVQVHMQRLELDTPPRPLLLQDLPMANRLDSTDINRLHVTRCRDPKVVPCRLSHALDLVG